MYFALLRHQDHLRSLAPFLPNIPVNYFDDPVGKNIFNCQTIIRFLPRRLQRTHQTKTNQRLKIKRKSHFRQWIVKNFLLDIKVGHFFDKFKLHFYPENVLFACQSIDFWNQNAAFLITERLFVILKTLLNAEMSFSRIRSISVSNHLGKRIFGAKMPLFFGIKISQTDNFSSKFLKMSYPFEPIFWFQKLFPSEGRQRHRAEQF